MLAIRGSVASYMDQCSAGAAIEDPEIERDDSGDDDALAACPSDRYEAVGYTETKRWFEGSGVMEDDFQTSTRNLPHTQRRTRAISFKPSPS